LVSTIEDIQNQESIVPPANRWLRRLKKLKTNKAGFIGTLIIFGLIFVAVSADLIAPYSYKEQNLSIMNSPPSKDHLMGTDEFGRDVFSRILHGSRISVYVGVVSVGLSVMIGVILGAFAGYYGGWLDQFLSVVTDLTWSLPEILVALLLGAILGAGLECVIVVPALNV